MSSLNELPICEIRFSYVNGAGAEGRIEGSAHVPPTKVLIRQWATLFKVSDLWAGDASGIARGHDGGQWVSAVVTG